MIWNIMPVNVQRAHFFFTFRGYSRHQEVKDHIVISYFILYGMESYNWSLWFFSWRHFLCLVFKSVNYCRLKHNSVLSFSSSFSHFVELEYLCWYLAPIILTFVDAFFSRYSFVLRIVLLLVVAWMTLLIFNSALIVVPISLGRALFNAIPLLPITHGVKCNGNVSFFFLVIMSMRNFIISNWLLFYFSL